MRGANHAGSFEYHLTVSKRKHTSNSCCRPDCKQEVADFTSSYVPTVACPVPLREFSSKFNLLILPVISHSSCKSNLFELHAFRQNNRFCDLLLLARQQHNT